MHIHAAQLAMSQYIIIIEIYSPNGPVAIGGPGVTAGRQMGQQAPTGIMGAKPGSQVGGLAQCTLLQSVEWPFTVIVTAIVILIILLFQYRIQLNGLQSFTAAHLSCCLEASQSPIVALQ